MSFDRYRDLREFTTTAERMAEPQHVGKVLSELIAMKGLARVHGIEQLHKAWRTVSGNELENTTRVKDLTRGVLTVAVSNSALVNELNSFHKQLLVEKIQQTFPHLKVRDIKFRLKTELK